MDELSTTARERYAVKQALAGVVDPRVLHTRNDVPATSMRNLLGKGWDCVTHQHVVQAAGYSRATCAATSCRG